jgi:hypothetical protein
MKLTYSIFCFLFSTFLFSQVNLEYEKVDKVMDKIPVLSTATLIGISDYISQNFVTEEEKIRAVFYWVAANISYDLKGIDQHIKNEDKVKTTLASRKGVCRHYAAVFTALSNHLGIQTIAISGYTSKKDGSISDLSHAWCVSKINQKWHLYDPTWGAGQIKDNKFFKKLNNFYFDTAPKELVKNHMPFDYMWQLLDYPISNNDFYNGKNEPRLQSEKYLFDNEIETYLSLSDLEKSNAQYTRIKKTGLKNDVISGYFHFLEDKKEHNEQNKKGLILKEVQDEFSVIIKEFNQYVKLKNNQINTKIPNAALAADLQNLKTKIENCEEEVSDIKNINPENIQNLRSFKAAIAGLKTRILEEQRLIKKNDVH